MQAKLLRALEESKVRPVGGEAGSRLRRAHSRGHESRFGNGRRRRSIPQGPVLPRECDPTASPPLRSRGTDTLLLAQHFIETFAARGAKSGLGISEPVAEKLLAYSWPGNVRELRNVVERAVALTRHDKLTLDDLPDKIRDFRSPQVVIAGSDPGELVRWKKSSGSTSCTRSNCLGGNRTLAAKTLGLDRKTLYRKLRQYGVLRDGEEA